MKEVINLHLALCRLNDLISAAKGSLASGNRFVSKCAWFCFMSLSLSAQIYVSNNTILSLNKEVFVSNKDTMLFFADIGQGGIVGDISKIFIVRGTIVRNLQIHSDAEIIYIPASEGVVNLIDSRRNRILKSRTGKNNIKPGKEYDLGSKLKASKSFADLQLLWSCWATLVTSSQNTPVDFFGAIRSIDDRFSLKENVASDHLKSNPSFTLRKTSFFVLSKHTTRPPPLMISKR